MKTGRGRVYHSLERYPSLKTFGGQLESIDELRLRLRDLLDDVPDELGNKIPEWTANSIFYLGAHMVWAEQGWIERAVNSQYQIRGVLDSEPCPKAAIEKSQLLTALDTVGVHVTGEYLEHFEYGECEFTQTGPFVEIGELLQHLYWHYSYHSGQVGLLRRYVGLPYQWNFG